MLDPAATRRIIGTFNAHQRTGAAPAQAVRAVQRAMAEAPVAHGLCAFLLLLSQLRNGPAPAPAAAAAGAASPGGPDRAPALLGDAVQRAFPRAAMAPQWDPPGAASAWPLPGATAARGRPGAPPANAGKTVGAAKAVAAKKPPVVGVRARGPAARRLSKQSSRQRLGDSGPPVDEARTAPRIAAASPAFADGQETLFASPLQKAAIKKFRPAVESFKPPAKAQAKAVPRAGMQPERALVPLAQGPLRLTPHCEVGGPQGWGPQWLLQVRHDRAPHVLCASARDAGSAIQAVRTPVSGGPGNATVVVPFPVRHLIAPGLRQLHVQRVADARSPAASTLFDPSGRALGDDVVWSVLTTTVLTQADEAPSTPFDAERRLECNSFRVVRHTDLGGTTRLFLGWFVNRESGACAGINAGYLEIFTDVAGEYSVEDASRGFAFVADSLDELIEGLQHTTDTRYIGPGVARDATSESGEVMVEPQPVLNLLVPAEEALSRRAPHVPLHFNKALDFFSPTEVQLQAQAALLYRHSYTLDGNRLVFVDEAGHSGTLHLVRRRRSNALVLRCEQARGLALARRLGLQEGHPYQMSDLVRAVRAISMMHIAHPPPACAVPDPGVGPGADATGQAAETTQAANLTEADNTEADEGEREAAASMPRAALQRNDAAVPSRRAFAFDPIAGALYYLDADGQRGQLGFYLRSRPRQGFVLASDDDRARQLALQTGIVQGVVYTAGALETLLDRGGYQSVPLSQWIHASAVGPG